MKDNKHKDHKSEMNSMNSKQPPDDRIKPVADEKQEETPQVFKIVKQSFKEPGGRRKFLRAVAGAAGMTLVAGVLGATCDGDKDPTGPTCTCQTDACTCDTEPVCTCQTDACSCDTESTCTCESVCTCDYDDDSKIFTERSGGVCTCNTVCTCDIMEAPCACDTEPAPCTCDTEPGPCTCDEVCTCDVVHYWYPN